MGVTVTRRAKQILMRPLARALRRERLTPAALAALRPRSIVVVRQHNQMGDMVCATPALRAIAETWPGARVALVTSPANAGVVRHNPHLARVLVFERPLRRLPAFVRELRNWDADLAIVLSSVSFSLTSALIGLACGARHVIGADSRPFGWEFSEHCFSLQMPAAPVVTTHAIDHGLEPLRAVGITTDDPSTVVVPSPEERARAAQVARELGLRPGYWVLHPGAGKRQNVWPAERFAALARRAVSAGRQVLVLHGPADREALGAFGVEADPRAAAGVCVAPPCDVGVAAALLEEADRFLCNDTGIMHVAGALRVPTLALFGPTDPGLWKPPAAEVVALRGAHRRDDPRGQEFGWMESLDEDDVWRAWAALAGRAAANRDG
jgi:ADP-heptose:LPS heptosyltransferase